MKHYDDEEAPEGWCESCGKPCYGVRVDYGIGPYEYWGYKGVDHDYGYASDCCKEPILDYDPCCIHCHKQDVYDEGLCLKCYEESVTV